MIAPPGFGSCPHCHRAGSAFNAETIELLEAYAGISIYPTRDGYTAEWEGQTDVNYDSSATVLFRCSGCKRTLPEDHQRFLEQALCVTRMPAEEGSGT